jgi:hypothetical protein
LKKFSLGTPENSIAGIVCGGLGGQLPGLLGLAASGGGGLDIGSLTRIIHEGLWRGGTDGHGYKAREGRIPQAESAAAFSWRSSASSRLPSPKNGAAH